MKKVTHVITTISRGGAENQLLVLAREQISNGWHVSIVYLKDEPELIDAFKKTGVEVITECAKHSVIGQVFWLRNYFKKQKSLIHAHLPRAELLTTLAAPKQSFVISRHNAEKFFPSAPLWISSLLSRLVTNRAKSGIAISKAVEIFLRSKNEIPKNFRISVIYYGYDNSLPANKNKKLNRADFGLKENDFIFGTIGRIVPQKDYPTLLRAFSIVSRDLNDCKLLIIGDGSLEIDMHKLSDELEISDKVVWYGRTNRIVEILNLMDCFVLASLYEGFGLVLLEAMSANIPIVASNISAIPEVLGIRYPLLSIPGDPSNFAMNMSLVANLSKKERLELLETQLIQLDKFNPYEMSKAIEKVYSEINV
jgi:glycosyltransferase involved in cell wall biosynthesis